ncbi:hypothetical protein IAD21_04670 [Abditibacteriota bacterium]|nr:hypothetical protein IAD21_04670 [Abditibacteriota bacterium]
MNDFRLEVWERPPNTEIRKISSPIEFGPVEWNGEKTMISARTVRFSSSQARAFFRPHRAEANFVISSGQTIYGFQAQMEGGKLERVVRKAVKREEFSFLRVFFLEGQLCLVSSFKSVWKSPDNQGDSAFEMPFDRMIEPSARIFEWLGHEWNNANSEVRFAWEWNRKNVQERQEFLAERIPRWREIDRVMRAVARVAELPENATWILDHVDTSNHAPQLLARLQPWRELLQKQFLPFVPLPDSAPQCLRDYFQFISNHIAVQGENVSYHEGLESRLFLREWIEGKATPAKIENLLGQL